MRKYLNKIYFRYLDRWFLRKDKAEVLRTRNILRIPERNFRRGGKQSYAEWAHVTGIFQTLIYSIGAGKNELKVLDVGCGTGLMAIAAEPFIKNGGSYTGIDVMKADLDFCRSHFTESYFHFIHHRVGNASYAQDESQRFIPWQLPDSSFDLVTALSVWTHLNQQDAEFYMKEVARVLKPGGHAIITFFYLDNENQILNKDKPGEGKFHKTPRRLWEFSRHAYDSKNWFTASWARVPEDVIGVNEQGMSLLLSSSGLDLVKHYPGNWKETPGVFFQDVLIFLKK